MAPIITIYIVSIINWEETQFQGTWPNQQVYGYSVVYVHLSYIFRQYTEAWSRTEKLQHLMNNWTKIVIKIHKYTKLTFN